MRTRRSLGFFRWFAVVLILTLTAMLAAPVQAATPEDIEDAITDGLAWLAAQQNASGAWQEAYYVGVTGLALLKFETHATFMGMSPFDPAYEYSDNVINGLNFIFANSHDIAIGITPLGYDPDTNGNGVGVIAYHPGDSSHSMYETGLALMAICASNDPDRLVTVGSQAGRTYAEVAQDMVDLIAWAQHDGPGADPDRGGWRYSPNYSDSDNSISGYVTLGLAYAEAPAPWGFGGEVTIPAFVFNELNLFIDALQDPVNGDLDDGGSWYVPASWNWVNILKTGNLLSEMALYGDGPLSPRAQNAVDYIERHWNDANQDPGWRGSGAGPGAAAEYQACFTMMKGFQSMGIENIDTGGGPFSWYDEMADRIVETQDADGKWSGDAWGGNVLGTAWAMLALEKAAPPAMALVPPFDINPPGTDHTVTATYRIAGEPVADIEILFEVISGPNIGEGDSKLTDAAGQASFTYTGAGGLGTDIIRATAVQTGISSQATKVWEAAPVEVGGTVYPADKLTMLAPWLLLTVAMIAGGAIVVKRRRTA